MHTSRRLLAIRRKKKLSKLLRPELRAFAAAEAARLLTQPSLTVVAALAVRPLLTPNKSAFGCRLALPILPTAANKLPTR